MEKAVTIDVTESGIVINAGGVTFSAEEVYDALTIPKSRDLVKNIVMPPVYNAYPDIIPLASKEPFQSITDASAKMEFATGGMTKPYKATAVGRAQDTEYKSTLAAKELKYRKLVMHDTLEELEILKRDMCSDEDCSEGHVSSLNCVIRDVLRAEDVARAEYKIKEV